MIPDSAPPPDAPDALDVLAVGELNPDLILARIAAEAPRLGTEQEAASFRLTLGSSTAICTVGLQRLGLRTALVAVVGDDDFGRFCRGELEREGIETRYLRRDPERSTGLTVALAYARDRLLVTHPGAMVHLAAEAVPDAALRRARHLHVASFFLQRALQPGLAGLFERARAHGATTSLDTGWDPADRWELERLAPALAHVDVFLPNHAELAALSGTEDLADGAAWALERGVGRVVVKRGARGAASFGPEGRASHAGYAVDAIDTTGAGDSFGAGYLFAFLGGDPERERLRLGNACGALAAAALGGTGGFGSSARVREFLAERDGADAVPSSLLPAPE